MGNIWEVFLHSNVALLVAGALLILQKIMAEHLTPRWCYGFWYILLLRLCFPVILLEKTVFPWLNIGVEQVKTWVESGLNSAYIQPYFPIQGRFSFPFFPTMMAQSVTDWIFVVYLLGVFVVLSRYFGGYLKLKILLKNSNPASVQLVDQVAKVSDTYKLRRWKSVEVEGLPSPFVCGVFRPILAFPAGKNVDDKVILHELVHLNKRHPLQNTVWCFFRALHWFNPLLQLVFQRVSNDMETECDYIVLEKLQEAQERKDYGSLLLSMAKVDTTGVFGSCNMGTSCISNGAKDLLRRITLISVFQKSPSHMGVFCACIIIIFSMPLLLGGKSSAIDRFYSHSLAVGRLNRSTTIASAVENYVQSMVQNDLHYFALVSPLSQQEELQERLKSQKETGAVFQHPTPFPEDEFYLYDYGKVVNGSAVVQVENLKNKSTSVEEQYHTTEFAAHFDIFNGMQDSFSSNSYYLYNLNLISFKDEAEKYAAQLVFHVDEVRIEGEVFEYSFVDGNEESVDTFSDYKSGYFMVPIEIWEDIDGKYVVIPQEGSSVYFKNITFGYVSSMECLPSKKFEKQGESGVFTMYEQTSLEIKDESADYYNQRARFTEFDRGFEITYDFHGDEAQYQDVISVSTVEMPLYHEAHPDFEKWSHINREILSEYLEIGTDLTLFLEYTQARDEFSRSYINTEEKWDFSYVSNVSGTGFSSYDVGEEYVISESSFQSTDYLMAIFVNRRLMDWVIFTEEDLLTGEVGVYDVS